MSQREGESSDEGWIGSDVVRAARRFAVSLVGRAEADDLVQDALARAWEKRALFDADRGSLVSWLLSIVADARRQQLRTTARREGVLGAGIPEVAVGSVDSLDARVDLRSAVDALPRAQREIVILFYYVDLSVTDIATLLAKSEGTVKSTLSDARRALASSLGASYAGH